MQTKTTRRWYVITVNGKRLMPGYCQHTIDWNGHHNKQAVLDRMVAIARIDPRPIAVLRIDGKHPEGVMIATTHP